MMNNFDIVNHNQLRFLKANPSVPFDLKHLAEADAIIIEYTNYQDVCNLLRDIRSHHEKAIYLKPCFLHNLVGTIDNSVTQLVDGTLTNLSNLDPLAIVVKKIQSRMK